MTRVRLAARAEQDAERIDEWWRESRTAAVDLFARELARIVALLERAPALGPLYRTVQGRAVRRVFLRGTRHHVYYWHDEGSDRVEIIAIWSAARGRGPRLT